MSNLYTLISVKFDSKNNNVFKNLTFEIEHWLTNFLNLQLKTNIIF